MTRLGLYLLAMTVLALDQTTKLWVIQVHGDWPDGSRPIIPGLFSFTWVNNTGGAFGILDSVRLGTDALALASALAAAAIIVYARRAPRLPALLGVALGLALGGAIGNLIDRVRLHYVVDFLDFHIGSHQWPVFNVADSAICVGVALLAIHYGRAPAQTTRAVPTDEQGT